MAISLKPIRNGIDALGEQLDQAYAAWRHNASPAELADRCEEMSQDVDILQVQILQIVQELRKGSDDAKN